MITITLLNADKTIIVNIFLNYHNEYNDPVILSSKVSISPSQTAKFLGITLDNHLSLSKHVESLVLPVLPKKVCTANNLLGSSS